MDTMYVNQRARKRFDVNWQGRILLSSGRIQGTRVLNVSEGGVAIDSPYAMSIGNELRLEFNVKYSRIRAQLRAKVTVVHNIVLANDNGAHVGLRFDYMSSDNTHKLNNVLRLLQEQMSFRYTADTTTSQQKHPEYL